MMVPAGKLDCTRSRARTGGKWRRILRRALLACLLGCVALVPVGRLHGQSMVPPRYPEIGRLGLSSYCNPYFGFRLRLPREMKGSTLHLPVEASERHMLLALRVARLDRTGSLYISAVRDPSAEPLRHAARERVQLARQEGLSATGPGVLKIGQRELLTVHVQNPKSDAPGDESSVFFLARDYVIQASAVSHDPPVLAALEKVLQHIEFMEPGEDSCREAPPLAATRPDATAAPPLATPPLERLYWGPALPTELVEETLKHSLGQSVPAGELAAGSFLDPALGLRVALLPGWQPLEGELGARIPELLRDPVTDAGSGDRRRALFRSCSRLLFAAHDPRRELLPEVHPSLAVMAMPLGCVPDMRPPETLDDQAELNDFATALLRSTGAQLLSRGLVRTGPGGRLFFNMDGTLPWLPPGEKLARRMSLRLTATTSGGWLLLFYSVAEAPEMQRELESHIFLGNAPGGHPGR
jgi:hypothetical protein